MQSYLFLGRAERVVIAILLLIALAALGLYVYTAHGRQRVEALPHSDPEAGLSQSRADTIYRDGHYVGPPKHMRGGGVDKFKKHLVLDLNRVDSLTLIRVPGIGPAFARRILSLRNRLGGYYTVLQLQEVYGMDEERFLSLRSWFAVQTNPKTYPLDSLRSDELPKHPYLGWEQQRVMRRLINRHGKIASWRVLMKESSFTRDDSIRLVPYFPDTNQSEERSSK